MRPLRVIETGEAPAQWNTGASFALLEGFERDPSADILRFYRFRKCVLIGRSQVAHTSTDLAYCRKQGISIARRITGGGAVYMSPRMLAWDFVTRASSGHAHLSEAIGRAVARALTSLDVATEFKAPNDLVTDGRKISGAATMSFGCAFLHQGTLLLEDDAEEMAAALRIPIAALRQHTTSITAYTDCALDHTALRDVIVTNLADAFDLVPNRSALSPHEAELAARDLNAEIGLDTPLRDYVSVEVEA